jgi:hypothetical protein
MKVRRGLTAELPALKEKVASVIRGSCGNGFVRGFLAAKAERKINNRRVHGSPHRSAWVGAASMAERSRGEVPAPRHLRSGWKVALLVDTGRVDPDTPFGAPRTAFRADKEESRDAQER